MKNTFIKRIFLTFLLISLACFLFLPQISLAANFDEITTENISKYLELSEENARKLLDGLIQEFSDKKMSLEVSPYSTDKEKVVAYILQKAVRIEALNYLLVDVPLEITYKIVKGAIEVARLVIAEDVSVALDKFEKKTVKKAVEYGMDYLLHKEIRLTPGVIEFEYTSISGTRRQVTFQYIVIYKPLDLERGEVEIRFYSPDWIEPPKSQGWFMTGIYHELEENLPPFIVDIHGEVEDYRWVDDPSIDISFPDYVPDLGIKPVSRLEKYVLQPLKEKIKETRVILERVVEKSGGIVEKTKSVGGKIIHGVKNTASAVKQGALNLFGKVKSGISRLNPFRAAVVPIPQEEETDTTVVLEEVELDKLKAVITSLEDKLETEKDLRNELESRYNSQINRIIEELDDLSEIVDVMTQKTTEIKQTEVTEVIEKLAETESLIENIDTEDSVGAGDFAEEEAKEGQLVLCELSQAGDPERDRIVFNEIAWMGTSISASDEWIELKDITTNEVDLAGWQILDKDGQIQIIFSSGVLSSGGFYLLERTDDDSVVSVSADKIYNGALNDTDEGLYLFNQYCELEDKILTNSSWPAGNKLSKRTMERKSNLGWQDSRDIGGTPRAENSSGYYFVGGGAPPPTSPSPTTPSPTSSSSESELCSQENLSLSSYSSIIINEIAWMGTLEDPNNEWFELKNISDNEISLKGWQILDKDGQIQIILNEEEKISFDGFYLLERTDDDSVPNILADKIYTGSLADTEESLRLFDQNCNLIDEVLADPNWSSGSKEEIRSMERKEDLGWQIYSGEGENGIMGTPKADNSQELPPISPPSQSTEESSLKILITEILFDIEGSDDGKEFVELYNPNDSKIDISAWSLQYLSPSATSIDNVKRKNFEEGNGIDAKSYFLIGLNGREGDISWGQALGNNGGTVLLVNDQGPESNISGSDDENIVDRVGYGTGSGLVLAEGAPISLEDFEPGKSIGRKWDEIAGEYQDTDDNSIDFDIQSPTPKAKDESIEESTSSFEIVISEADTVWNLNLDTASSDIIDSTDALSQNLDVVFVSHEDASWSLDFTVAVAEVLDSSDAPLQTLFEAFVSMGDVVWNVDLEDNL
jgi:hypothetical protein